MFTIIDKSIHKVIKISLVFLVGIALYNLIKQNIYHDSLFVFVEWMLLIGTVTIICQCRIPWGGYAKA
ncbi:MAG: hypothetical protein K2P14_00690 [Anaeroplasmataceae bacterium]|nr:hypothetical protein [Anaeroplasmataceae bacterium]